MPHKSYKCPYKCPYVNIPVILDHYAKIIQNFYRKKILCKNKDVLYRVTK